MALKVNFTNNNLGIPMPHCYLKVETALYDSIEKVVRAFVVFYVNQDQRENDLREQRKRIETDLEVAKAEMVSEQRKPHADVNKLDRLIETLHVTQTQLETATGDSPFYGKLFEFPVTGQEEQNILALVYEKLKQTGFSGIENGRRIELDFTKAVDV